MNYCLNESSKTLTDILMEECYAKGIELGKEEGIEGALRFGLSKEEVMSIFNVSTETYERIWIKVREESKNVFSYQ